MRNIPSYSPTVTTLLFNLAHVFGGFHPWLAGFKEEIASWMDMIEKVCSPHGKEREGSRDRGVEQERETDPPKASPR